ncbi:hypothetical protein HW453_02765 [Treponema phagedenis]|nr:hypothetical protein [Treponema phagedenis]QKS92340.1 hypothetical protein HPJ96_07120 [Treponema phagedenis]QLC57850.1 hypothetical protein HW453_02765 [Treponema phagedenis]
MRIISRKGVFMRRSIGVTILQIALAFFLLVSGITGLMYSTAGEFGKVVDFLSTLFQSRTVSTIIVMAIAICELIAAIFLLVDLFSPSLAVVRIILIIFIVLWIINLVLVDIIGAFGAGNVFRNVGSVLQYLKQVSFDLMVLGSLILVQRRSE